MRPRLVVLTALLVAASAIASSAVAPPPQAPARRERSRRRPRTRCRSCIGPRQEMYMPSEVQARKLKHGQVMLGGAMAMIDKVPAGMKVLDLQVHVCTKTGAVITAVKPVIVVQQPGGKATNVPVAMMAAVGKGLGDYHYGNDVLLKPGAAVTVTVTLKGQRAVFHTRAPFVDRGGVGYEHGLSRPGRRDYSWPHVPEHPHPLQLRAAHDPGRGRRRCAPVRPQGERDERAVAGERGRVPARRRRDRRP